MLEASPHVGRRVILINTKAAWGHRRQGQVGLVLSTQSPCKQIDGRMRWFPLSDGRLKEVTK
jgi:hypothetical protein